MLRRTGFKRRAIERKPPVLTPISRPYSAAPAALVAAPKGDEPVRSKALREAYRLIPCQHCGAEDGTVVCAHSNWSIHGKAGARKAHDNRSASLCFGCHGDLDQGGRMSSDEKRLMWWHAHRRSVLLLTQLGHWPAGVPVPDVDTMPWPELLPK